MVRAALWFGILFLSAALVSAAPARAEFLSPFAQKLKYKVNFGGFEQDERMTLREALDQLSELYSITFKVNEKAFRREMVKDVLDARIVALQAVPKMSGVTLGTVVQQILDRVPVSSGVAYIARRDAVEITTIQAWRMEILSDTAQCLLPPFSAYLQGRLLGDVLKEIAERTGFSVVLAPQR